MRSSRSDSMNAGLISSSLPRDPLEVAEQIRREVRDELGLTVSIGVSFNKVFAKLGSDMNKPDGITVITRQNYRDTVLAAAVCGAAVLQQCNSKAACRDRHLYGRRYGGGRA